MKNRGKIRKLLTLVLSFLFVFLTSAQPVDAYYESNENKLVSASVNKKNNALYLEFEYQYGISNLVAYICPKNINGPGNCSTNGIYITKFSALVENGNTHNAKINELDSKGRYTITLSSPVEGDQINTYNDKYDESDKLDNDYNLAVFATFCMLRNEENDGCLEWNEDSRYHTMVIVNIGGGFTESGELNTTIAQMLRIVNRIVIPVLWVILGVFLIVRGIMLTVDIVKSADEPEVRKKKINGLIWLIIGVFIGYIITIVASVIMSAFGYGGIFS